MEQIAVIQGTGKRASKWVKVALTDDPQLLADEISERNPMEFKVKHTEVLPPSLPFEEVEECLLDTAEEAIDGFYLMTVTSVKRLIKKLLDDEERESVTRYTYADDERDREFNGEVADG